MTAVKRYLAFDVGCIECGESSAVIGTFATADEAKVVAGAARIEQRRKWGRQYSAQHSFEVYDLRTGEYVP